MMATDGPEHWRSLPFFGSGWPALSHAIDRDTRTILPPAAQRFAALEACAPKDTRVVILGQDPYPTQGHAHGLAFSVEPGVKLPRSLSNIFRELTDDLGACPPDGDLRFWTAQGVLLLNTALTVPEGEAGGHAKLGWARLTEQVLDRVSDKPTAFLLWGAHAQGFARHIRGDGHLVLRSAHPSPLSARRGFFGSRPFSRINAWLKENGETPINWTSP